VGYRDYGGKAGRATHGSRVIRGRWVLAVAFVGVYGICTGSLVLPTGTAVAWIVLAAVLGALAGWVLYMMAMQRAPAHEVTTLASTVPLWGVLASILFLNEPFRWSAFVAAALVVAGAFFLVGGRNASTSHNHRVGALFARLTGVLWGVAETVPMKKALQLGATPETILAVFGGVAPSGSCSSRRFFDAGSRGAWNVAGMGSSLHRLSVERSSDGCCG